MVYRNWVIGRSNKAITIYDVRTGQQLWTDTADYANIPDAPLVVQDGILAFSVAPESVLKVVNLRELKLLWHQGDGSLGPQVSSLALDAHAVYASWIPGPATVAAYDLQTGKLLWRQMQGDWGNPDSLVPRGDELYVFSGVSEYVLDSRTGAMKRRLNGLFKDRIFQFIGDTAYQGDSDGLAARSISTGEMDWAYPRPMDNCFGIDKVIDGTVYGSFECVNLVALNAEDGHIYWQTEFPAHIVSEVATIGKTGYVMLADGSISGFDLATGQEVGRLETSPTTTSHFSMDNGLATDGELLFATFGDNQLFAFGK